MRQKRIIYPLLCRNRKRERGKENGRMRKRKGGGKKKKRGRKKEFLNDFRAKRRDMYTYERDRARTRILISFRIHTQVIRTVAGLCGNSTRFVRYSGNLRNSIKEKVVALMYT